MPDSTTAQDHLRRLLLGELPFFSAESHFSPMDLSRPVAARSGLTKFQTLIVAEVSHLEQQTAITSSEKESNLRFPTEVWLRIFGYATITSQRSVAHAATLSSGIHGAAEEALYKFPEILSVWSATKFASTIRQSTQHARLVRGLSLGYPEKQAPSYLSELNGTLPSLTRLHTLDFVGITGDECIPEWVVHDLLADKDGAPLKMPALRRIRGLPLYLSPRILQLLRAQGRLEELNAYRYTPFPHHRVTDSGSLEDTTNPTHILRRLPNLRALSCPFNLADVMSSSGKITSLDLRGSGVRDATDLEYFAVLFGPQLVALRLERRLKAYIGMAYPTSWSCWSSFPRLRFLDIRDAGMRRKGSVDSKEMIKPENLPSTLEILLWSPTWVMDCALVDSRSEEWRRAQIRSFAETVLRRAHRVQAVVYHWRNDESYQCVLAGGKESGRYQEFRADSASLDPHAWADKR